MIYRLSEGLVQIADLLPRAELTVQLYPIPPLRQTITKIYSHVLRFLVRALGWYQESKLMHALHSITRPTELRYDDILASVSSLSLSMSSMAAASSHAEQRDMHIDIRQTQSRVEYAISLILEMKASKAADRVLGESATMKLHQQISEVQLVQLLDQIKVTQMPDPAKAFQASLFWTRKRRANKPSTARGPAFWLTDKVLRWNQSSTSSLVAFNGTRNMKFHLQGFCAQSIAMLRDAKIPVIWALKTMVPEGRTADAVSSIDLLKYLVSQAIAVNKSIHTDAALAPSFKSYIGAQTEGEWVSILGSVLQGIPYLYIIIDIEVLSRTLASPAQDFWPAIFFQIFAELSSRGSKTVVRVALVSYSSSLSKRFLGANYEDCIVTVGRARQAQTLHTRLPRRGKSASGSLGEGMLNLTQLASGSSSRTGREKHLKRAQHCR